MSAEWLSVSQPQGRRNRGREAESIETSEVRDEMWGEVRAYVLAFVWNWVEVGFRYKSNGAYCTFFFIWISAWIVCFGRYNRFRPELARFRANRPESEPRQHESAKSTWNPRGTMRRDARAEASPARRRVGRGCGTSSAVSVLHSYKFTMKKNGQDWNIMEWTYF